MRPDLNRRAFLQAAAATTLIPASLPAQIRPQDSSWYDRPMRWAQLAFVEDDPGNYDQAFWIDYFRRIHADAACLSAGGCVAFYPTKVPLHYRSQWLGDRDSFGDLVKGCRDLRMNVIARTDPHAVHQDIYDAHPDWIAVDASGAKRRHWSDRALWVTCAYGPYNFEYMPLIHNEIMGLYQVDGIFTNRWAGSGMCYCEHCETNFRKFSGLALPRTLDPQVPERRQYIIWREKRLFELWRLWDSQIKAINPNAAYLANAGGGALSELDMKTIGEIAPTLFADRQARRGTMPPWGNGKNGKEYRATMGSKAVAGIFSVGLEEEYRWKDSVQSGPEIRMWAVDGIAQGLRPWFTKFNAKPIDKRWLPVVEELYIWHHRNERYLRNQRSLARVGMVYSQQTATFYGGEQARAKVEDAALGYYQALVEARIPFEMVHDKLLDETHLAPFRTLVLPNIAALSDTQCRQLQAFVARGGSLVATYETSLYDEWGVRRKDFGLASLFGVSFDQSISGGREGPMLNSYLTLERDPASGKFPLLLAGLEDATRIINGVHRVRVRQTAKTLPSPLTVVPTYPDLPMEAVFPRPAEVKEAGVFLRQTSAGRVVYFPFDLDRTFWEILDVDHAKLLKNAVLWASNQPQPLVAQGPGLIDISIWMQESSMTVHLVNLTNPMAMKGPLREIIPLSRQHLSIEIPAGVRVGKAQYLVAGKEAHYHLRGSRILLDIPSIQLHEVIAFEVLS